MLELLFSFKGRVNRTGFWIISLVIMVGAVIAYIIDRVTTDEEIGIATALYVLITLWPSLAIQAKRWHDRKLVLIHAAEAKCLPHFVPCRSLKQPAEENMPVSLA